MFLFFFEFPNSYAKAVFDAEMVVFKQVCSNKDASEGRDKDGIAERYLSDLDEFVANCLQVYCILFAGYLLFNSHRIVSNPVLSYWSYIKALYFACL